MTHLHKDKHWAVIRTIARVLDDCHIGHEAIGYFERRLHLRSVRGEVQQPIIGTVRNEITLNAVLKSDPGSWLNCPMIAHIHHLGPCVRHMNGGQHEDPRQEHNGTGPWSYCTGTEQSWWHDGCDDDSTQHDLTERCSKGKWAFYTDTAHLFDEGAACRRMNYWQAWAYHCWAKGHGTILRPRMFI